MKKLQANNLQAANETLQKLQIKVPKQKLEIDEANQYHYHCILIKVIDRPGEIKNDAKVEIVKYHKLTYEKMLESYKFQGYSYMILLHDASKVQKPSKVATQDEVKIKAELKAELEKEFDDKFEARFQERLAELEKDKNKGGENKKTPIADLLAKVDSMKLEELKQVAIEYPEIDLKGLTKKDEIHEKVKSYLQSKKV